MPNHCCSLNSEDYGPRVRCWKPLVTATIWALSIDFSPGPGGSRHLFGHVWFLFELSITLPTSGGLHDALSTRLSWTSPAYLRTFCIVDISSLLCEHIYSYHIHLLEVWAIWSYSSNTHTYGEGGEKTPMYLPITRVVTFVASCHLFIPSSLALEWQEDGAHRIWRWGPGPPGAWSSGTSCDPPVL